ncbi:TetR/AcrR family transcriptional regulator [Lentzea cavernae]|uniref:TetR family transcriptional regulator n=1 Tax=Lentzea cavernae TaxID=2020703 RepID=A0ABQ3MEU6_9PSEU|nr:TetR/AcrR family transcriptional regulator [Lentzea cavernae]GHH42614.1 TetR family transcriptional regulator [Lentzea cavernae]
MPRVAGRTPEDTRRVLLDAAGSCIRARGTSATLDHIAKEAGVSKGGLLHHFATKDDLVRALAQDLFDRFRADVLAAADLDDVAPGRLTRAYVRVSAEFSHDPGKFRDLVPLLSHLATVPEITELAREDTLRWHDDLAADGLPPHVTALITAAADGISAMPAWHHHPDRKPLTDLEALLIGLTTPGPAWDHLAPPRG